MPVYEQTYLHYEGHFRPHSLSWTLIAGKGIVNTWRKRWLRLVLTLCLVPFIVMTLRLYLAANLELLEYFGLNLHEFHDILEISEKFYYNFLVIQLFPCFVIAILTGADLIASDRRTKALTLYLSKPITRLDYLFGKTAIALFFLYLVSLIPCLLLIFLYAFFNSNWSYLWQNGPLIFRIVVLAHVFVIPLTALILAISSMTRSRVTATVMFCVAFFIPDVLVGILRNLVGRAWMNPDIFTLFSLRTILEQIRPVIFQQQPPYSIHWFWYALVLSAVVVLCGVILNKQIKAVEVVK